ncbi:hypothetical protein OAT76_05285, partial [Flavobacteriaceae bacterium]|nr:hypothetical protein [Flavobacteriaceae bacterium]
MNNNSKLNLKLGSVASINTVFGVVFQFLILYAYGLGEILDSYFIALSIIQFFYTILNTGILKVFTIKLKESEHYKLIFSQNLIVYLFTIIVFSFVMYFLSNYITKIFDSSEFSTNYFKILIFTLPFGVVTFICSSLLHSKKDHVTPELLSLTSFILFIVFFLIFYTNIPNYALPLSFIFKEAILSILLIFKCRKNFVTNNLVKTNMIIFNELKVIFAGNLIYKAGPIIDKFLLAGFPSGSISILNYAELAFNSTNRVINRVFE